GRWPAAIGGGAPRGGGGRGPAGRRERERGGGAPPGGPRGRAGARGRARGGAGVVSGGGGTATVVFLSAPISTWPSRSASACRAIARFILAGSWMSFSSTSVTSTPHSTVLTSRILQISRLILSVSDRVWSRLCCPTTFRSVVWAIWSIAE